MHKKFLVTNKEFYIGIVDFHKQFISHVDDIEKPLGGGWWHIDDNKDLILYASSDDFGYSSKEDVLKSLENLNPEDYTLQRMKRMKINKIYLSTYSIISLALERKDEAELIDFNI